MRGDTVFLMQLVGSLADFATKLEEAKSKNKIDDFNKIKKLILDIQEKINEEIKNV